MFYRTCDLIDVVVPFGANAGVYCFTAEVVRHRGNTVTMRTDKGITVQYPALWCRGARESRAMVGRDVPLITSAGV